MTIVMVPVNPVPSQSLSIVLDKQNIQIWLYQQINRIFCDVAINGTPITTCVLCQNLNRIVRKGYSGFRGDLMFYDTSGAKADPVYSGLGSRFVLLYVDQTEIPDPIEYRGIYQ